MPAGVEQVRLRDGVRGGLARRRCVCRSRTNPSARLASRLVADAPRPSSACSRRAHPHSKRRRVRQIPHGPSRFLYSFRSDPELLLRCVLSLGETPSSSTALTCARRTGALCIQAIHPILLRVPRIIFVLLFTAIYLACALAGREHLSEIVSNFAACVLFPLVSRRRRPRRSWSES